MSITDELRRYIHREMWDLPKWKDELQPIADRIDAEHQKALDEWKAEHGQMWLKGYSECHAELMEGNETLASDLERCGWVRLPVDADGVPIRVGDVVTMQLLFGGESKPLVVDRMELSHGRDGDLWCIALDTDKGCWNQPSLLRHYTPPTVEDVLAEFHERMDELGTTDQCVGADRADAVDALLRERAELVAEYAKRLRLAGDAE